MTVIEHLRQMQSFVLTSHVFPDPDAMGSSAGLALGLAALGKQAEVFLPNADWEPLEPFLGKLSRVETPEKREGFVILDTSNRERVNSDGHYDLGNTVINIDHHVSNSHWADVNLVDAEAPSSTVIVLDLLEELEAPISADCANLLFAGLMDDTGSFRFSNATERAFGAALRLLQYGATPEVVAERLFFSVSESVLRLRAHALQNFETAFQSQVVLYLLDIELLKELGLTIQDTEGVVDEIRKVKEARVAIFAREMEPGVWKGSLRSKDPVLDMNKVAQTLGGGGHAAAAGCKLRGPRESIREQLLSSIEAAL